MTINRSIIAINPDCCVGAKIPVTWGMEIVPQWPPEASPDCVLAGPASQVRDNLCVVGIFQPPNRGKLMASWHPQRFSELDAALRAANEYVYSGHYVAVAIHNLATPNRWYIHYATQAAFY